MKVFALLSALIHIGFALLFANLTLSFPPPPVKELSLTIMTRGGGQGEVIQSEAGWPTPKRFEPDFSAEKALQSLDDDIPKWIEYGTVDSSLFVPDDALTPNIDIAQLAAKADEAAPEEIFSHLPAESKTRPIPDFAVGPAMPEIFGSD